MMWVVGKEGSTKRIVCLIKRGKTRSKYYTLLCWCKRPRKDGTCKYTDPIWEHIIPDARPRVRIEHPEAGPRGTT